MNGASFHKKIDFKNIYYHVNKLLEIRNKILRKYSIEKSNRNLTLPLVYGVNIVHFLNK